MPGRLSDLKEKWLSLTCPACRTKMRIREAYAHLKGRCPECGLRIAAPRPQAAPPLPAFSDADEPLGLMPIEDEWPEPARVERLEEDPHTAYGIGAPIASPPLPRPIGSDEDELFQLAMADHDASTPIIPAPKEQLPYGLHRPAGEKMPTSAPLTYQLSRAELNPLRAPEPPRWPLWQGIYLFPWRGDSLVLWITLSLKMGVAAVLMCFLHVLVREWQGNNAVYGIAIPIVIPLFCLVALWTGAYGSVQLLGILEDTAAGNDRVPRPEWTIAEGIMRFGYLVWVGAASMIPGMLLGLLTLPFMRAGLATGLAVLAVSVVAFPVLLLSSLAAQAAWILLEPRFLSRLLARPAAILAMSLPPFVLFVPCVLLAAHAYNGYDFLAAFLGGFLWAAVFLVYARLLGRVAWYTTLRTTKRKKPKKVEPDAD